MAGRGGGRVMGAALHETTNGWRVQAPTYQLTVFRGLAHVRLADATGGTWTWLSVLASVHRIGVSDETCGTIEVEVGTVGDVHVFRFPQESTAWESKVVVLEARLDAVHLRVEVQGEGLIDTITLAGGDAITERGACGRFRSSIRFASLFTPGPTEPVQVVRPATSGALLGVVGDAGPGRLNGVFSPPPLAFAVSRAPVPVDTDGAPPAATAVPDGDWLGISILCDVGDASFTSVVWEPLDGGWDLAFSYEGHTRVAAAWTSPTLRLIPAGSPWEVLADHSSQVHAAADAPSGTGRTPPWWLEPIFCGWGCQCARAVADVTQPGISREAVVVLASHLAPSLSRQDLYDEWLARLERAGVVPGTIVIDDKWQARYGTCEVDTDKWPDLPGWIAARHAAGQKVLLWFKAWDPEGLPREECVVDARGHPVAADPSNPVYLWRLARTIEHLISPEGLDADGFKVDFTQYSPSGRSLVSAGDREPGGGPWGIAALHALLATLHGAAKSSKPDALVVTHAVDPAFADVTDMVRLNDVLKRDPAGVRVPVVEQLRFRSAVVRAAVPFLPVDTDQWPMPDREQWLAYVAEQPFHGVPALYYAESIDRSGEDLSGDDLLRVADGWRRYRDGLRRG